MEPTKFEEQSREKFEERELQPSTNAWDSLEKMLEAETPAKKKSGFPWFAIAATFIGFIIIVSIVFNNASVIDSPEFVEENTPSELLETKEVIPQENRTLRLEETQKEMVATTKETNNETESKQRETKQKVYAPKYTATEKASIARTNGSNKKEIKDNEQQKKSGVVTFQKPKDAIAYSSTQKKEDGAIEISEEKTSTPVNTSGIINGEAVAENALVHTTDVDALLKDAQQKLRERSDQKTQKVDAMALLGDIEMGREQSLRTKVIYALGEGFEYVKSNVTEIGN